MLSCYDRKLLYELRYNMEPVLGDNKEKIKASQTVVADKNKAIKQPEVTNVEKKVKF